MLHILPNNRPLKVSALSFIFSLSSHLLNSLNDLNPPFSYADPTCNIFFRGAFCKDTVKVEQADSRKLPSGSHTADAHRSLEKSIWRGGGRSCGLADKGINEKEMRRVLFFS